MYPDEDGQDEVEAKDEAEDVGYELQGRDLVTDIIVLVMSIILKQERRHEAYLCSLIFSLSLHILFLSPLLRLLNQARSPTPHSIAANRLAANTIAHFSLSLALSLSAANRSCWAGMPRHSRTNSRSFRPTP